MAGRIWYKIPAVMQSGGRGKKKRSLLGGKNVTSTGLEDIFYKCQISHPVQSDFHVGVPPTQSHSASPSPLSSLAPLSSGGGSGAVTQTTFYVRQERQTEQKAFVY